MIVTNIGSNMTEIRTGRATILVSYSTPVAAYIQGKFYITEKYWSATTNSHINKWLVRKCLTRAKAETRPQEFFDELLEK